MSTPALQDRIELEAASSGRTCERTLPCQFQLSVRFDPRPEERAEVARFLDRLVERPTGKSGVIRRRRISIGAAAVGALVMLPWIGYLATALPLAESGGAWRVAWVGFDLMLALVLMTTAWLGFHRRQVAILGLLVASTMLFTDAWFDVALSYGTREQWGAVLSAAFLEIPFAVLLASSAILILQRTSSTVARLRGLEGPPPSLWQQQFLVSPSPPEGR